MPKHSSGSKDVIEKIRGHLEELQEKVCAIRESCRNLPEPSNTSVTSQAAEYKSTSICELASIRKSSTLGEDSSWVKNKDISLKISDRTMYY